MKAPDAGLVLIVEDDAKIADMLANYLHMHGHTTHICPNGLEAVQAIRSRDPVLVLLDLMLPGMDGLAICRDVRRFSSVPIIMVTARVDEIDRLLGLDTGADDYICKPFSPREVVARIKAVLRRSHGQPTASVSNRGLWVNAAHHKIEWQHTTLPFTPVEYRLLAMLLSRPGHVFPRAKLLDHLHDDLRDVSDRAIDSHVKNIRRKLEQTGITTVTITSVYG
ncbi:MAG: hypothetical protein RJA09_1470, partial [Pseudomonadota bacterium]